MSARAATLAAFSIFWSMSGVHSALANLLLNPGFEAAPNNNTGQGLMPSNWIALQSIPDTWSNDGSYGLLPGSPSSLGDFDGVTAHGGIRWVAGAAVCSSGPFCPNAAEDFKQILSTPLVDGQSYTISGWLHQAIAAISIRPAATTFFLTNRSTRTLVAHLGSTPNTLAWYFYSDTFVAPMNAGSLGTIEFEPVTSFCVPGCSMAYPGLDDVDLEGVTAAVPEPTSMGLMGSALACCWLLKPWIKRRRKQV
jgi:PEP-CTERM motif